MTAISNNRTLLTFLGFASPSSVMVVEYSYLRWYDWNRAVRDAENRNASN